MKRPAFFSKEIKNLRMKQENGDRRLEFYREHNVELTFNHYSMITILNTVTGKLSYFNFK